MAFLNIAAIRYCTNSEGPGKRFAIWCQGCLRRCHGCCNPSMQPLKRRNVVPVDALFKLIEQQKEKDGIEGVSFIGGEPILQVEGFVELAKNCQSIGLSVLIFTGFTYDELISANNLMINNLLKYTDILVDGEFIESLYDEKRDWVGSTNQRVLFLSDRYKPGIEFEHGVRTTELRISQNIVSINGWPIDVI